MPKRVVITAMGVVSALGDDAQRIALGFQSGQAAFRRAEIDPQWVVCPVDDFDVRRYTGRNKNLRYLNRGAQLAAAAAVRALQGARLGDARRETAGLFVGSGPNLDIGGEVPEILDGHMPAERLSALWMLRFLPNTAASVIAQMTGLHGENLTVGTACTASLQAVGEAFRKIRDGYLTLALAGGGDSRLNRGALLAYDKAQALFRGEGAAHEASRPFDCRRQGFVPGEGAAFFMLEEASHAMARGADILGEILGYGAALDGHAMTAPRPDGRWAEQAVRQAMDQAALKPDQIDAVSTHGTGTLLNDAMEAALLERVYGTHQPLILAFKSWIGHLASACGAVELALCLSARSAGLAPAVRNLHEPCHAGLKYARQGGTGAMDTVVLQNFGFGGQNAALVLGSWQS